MFATTDDKVESNHIDAELLFAAKTVIKCKVPVSTKIMFSSPKTDEVLVAAEILLSLRKGGC